MKKLPRRRLMRFGILLVLLLGVALVALRLLSSRPAGPITLHYLGPVTNLVDPGWTWAAFSISNGTSTALFYQAAGVDYRSAAGWASAPWPLTPGRGPVGIYAPSNSLVIAASNSATFFAGVPAPSLPWRLRVTYREMGVVGSLMTSFHRLSNQLRGLPPSTSWSGTPHLLVGDEIAP